MQELKVWLRSALPTVKQAKSMIGIWLLVTIIFTSIMLYRTSEVDPPRDAEYAQIHGTEED